MIFVYFLLTTFSLSEVLCLATTVGKGCTSGSCGSSANVSAAIVTSLIVSLELSN